jgi:DNA-binding NtrC family response regulator
MPDVRSNGSRRVLFVDDEAGIRATLPKILRKHSFDVTVASSVPEALKLIEEHQFDLLLCDLNINGTSDGYEVVRAIRRVNPNCATIVLTGYPGLESAVEGIHLQIDDYLIKPSDANSLIALLAKRLADREPKGKILSVSYDEVLLSTRHLLLEREGYEVTSVMGLEAAMEKCHQGDFDIFVLGHSIDPSEKRQMAEAFRRSCPAPIISLRRSAGDELVDGAEYHIDPDPETMLKLINRIVQLQSAAKQKAAPDPANAAAER